MRAREVKRLMVEYRGKMLSTRELAALAGVSPRTMYQRLQQMSAEAAVARGKAPRGKVSKGPFTACGCKDCRSRRPQSKPRTDAERDARWAKETELRRRARAEGRL